MPYRLISCLPWTFYILGACSRPSAPAYWLTLATNWGAIASLLSDCLPTNIANCPPTNPNKISAEIISTLTATRILSKGLASADLSWVFKAWNFISFQDAQFYLLQLLFNFLFLCKLNRYGFSQADLCCEVFLVIKIQHLSSGKLIVSPFAEFCHLRWGCCSRQWARIDSACANSRSALNAFDTLNKI